MLLRTRPGARAAAGLLALASLTLASPAAGQDSPSDSAIDEYIESVPGSRGDEPSFEAAGEHEEPLSETTQRALEGLGPAGQQAAGLAAATTPEGTSDKDDADAKPGGVIGQIVDPSDDGLGIWLPLILAAALVSGGVVWWRRRGES